MGPASYARGLVKVSNRSMGRHGCELDTLHQAPSTLIQLMSATGLSTEQIIIKFYWKLPQIPVHKYVSVLP